ncbi:MAG: hypothetical protein BGO98_05055 [Myxococcales bacterium 68-20]|nr:MAG: hypothetical protein BGO98_05055 [Myxococcales bacterium 68-20]
MAHTGDRRSELVARPAQPRGDRPGPDREMLGDLRTGAPFELVEDEYDAELLIHRSRTRWLERSFRSSASSGLGSSAAALSSSSSCAFRAVCRERLRPRSRATFAHVAQTYAFSSCWLPRSSNQRSAASSVIGHSDPEDLRPGVRQQETS